MHYLIITFFTLIYKVGSFIILLTDDKLHFLIIIVFTLSYKVGSSTILLTDNTLHYMIIAYFNLNFKVGSFTILFSHEKLNYVIFIFFNLSILHIRERKTLLAIENQKEKYFFLRLKFTQKCAEKVIEPHKGLNGKFRTS